MLDIVREHVAPLIDKRVEEEVVDIVVQSSIRLAPVFGVVNIHGRGKCWSCWVGGEEEVIGGCRSPLCSFRRRRCCFALSSRLG